jgi:hypothetical protein
MTDYVKSIDSGRDLESFVFSVLVGEFVRQEDELPTPGADNFRVLIFDTSCHPPDHLSYPASWWDFWWEIFIF